VGAYRGLGRRTSSAIGRLGRLTLSALVVTLLFLPAVVASGQQRRSSVTVSPGYDLFATDPGTSVSLAGPNAIPAGFFGTGSEQFSGTVPLQGIPIGYFNHIAIGDTDTIIHRLAPADLSSPTGTATIPIQLVQLSLMGTSPITIHFLDGTTELWDVTLQQAPVTQPHGSLTLHGSGSVGGVFDATIPVIPKLTFRLEGTNEIRTVDLGTQTIVDHNVAYTYDASGRLVRVLHPGFCGGCVNGNSHGFEGTGTFETQHLHATTTLTGVSPGYDLFETMMPGTMFTVPPSKSIPANFFGPGSDAWNGTVNFYGQPIGTFNGVDTGTADTVVHRLAGADFSHSNTAMVPIQLVALSLRSAAPITVTYTNHHTEMWDVSAAQSPSFKSTGTMKMIKGNDSGGTFDTTQFNVYPKLTFTRVAGGPTTTRELDLGQPALRKLLGNGIQFKQAGSPWQRGCRGPALIDTKLSKGFCPGLSPDAKKVTTEEEAMLAKHGVRPAQPLEIPPITCGPFVPPPPLKLKQGQSGQVDCPLKRHDFAIDSFFDVFVTIDVGSGGTGVGGTPTPSSVVVRRRKQRDLKIEVTTTAGASVGTHMVPVKVTRSVGDDKVASFFDVFVDVSAALPAVTSTSPVNNATSVSLDSSIMINFNQEVSVTGTPFQLDCPSGTPVAFNASSSPASSYTLTPVANLPASTVCDVKVVASDVTGAGGNMAADYGFSFTTDSPPQVSSTTPQNNDTNVSTNSTITINFDKPVTPSNGAFMLGCIEGMTLTPIPYMQSSSAGGATWTLTPNSGLPPNTGCAVHVTGSEISDAAGTTMTQPYQFGFQTGT
jgi:Bacterial Ig-like domain